MILNNNSINIISAVNFSTSGSSYSNNVNWTLAGHFAGWGIESPIDEDEEATSSSSSEDNTTSTENSTTTDDNTTTETSSTTEDNTTSEDSTESDNNITTVDSSNHKSRTSIYLRTPSVII